MAESADISHDQVEFLLHISVYCTV